MQVNGLVLWQGVRPMDRVLLTGFAGYIGQYCVTELLRQGDEMVNNPSTLSGFRRQPTLLETSSKNWRPPFLDDPAQTA